MIGITELIEYQKSYIEYVFDNIDWWRIEDLTDEDERMEHFLFEATNNWIEGFDFVDFIADSYKINDIENVITGKTVCDLIQITHIYYMDNVGECHIAFGNINVENLLRNWVYVITNYDSEEILEKIREKIRLDLDEKSIEQQVQCYIEDSYEMGYK